MKLWEINGNAVGVEQDNPIKQVVLNEMKAEAPILEKAEFYSFVGNSDNVLPLANGAAGAFRAVNSDYTGVTLSPGNEVNIPLKILGDNIKTDRAYQPRGLDIAGEHLRQLRPAAKALARYFTDQFINGDGTNNSITGLKTVIAGEQLLTYDSGGDGTVPFGTSTANIAKQKQFLESLELLINSIQGGPACLIMNDTVIARLKTIARDFLAVTTITDAIGNLQVLNTYFGIPIVNAGLSKNGSAKIIGNAETVAAKTACTSVYAVKFGEREDTTFATTPAGLLVQYDSKDANFVTTKIELQYNLKVLNLKTAQRLQGIVIS